MTGDKLIGYALLAVGAVLMVLGWTGVIRKGWSWLGGILFVVGWYRLRRNHPDATGEPVIDAIDLVDGDIDILD